MIFNNQQKFKLKWVSIIPQKNHFKNFKSIIITYLKLWIQILDRYAYTSIKPLLQNLYLLKKFSSKRIAKKNHLCKKFRNYIIFGRKKVKIKINLGH